MSSICDQCGLSAEVCSDYLHQASAVAIPHPARLLCRHCVERLGLSIEQHGAHRLVRFQGREYRLFSGMFLRPTEPPQVVSARYVKSDL